MAVNKVSLYVSQILNDLSEGLTWLQKDDLGYGSIQQKYGAKEMQIMQIRQHPALKDAETTVTIFQIIDDTKHATTGAITGTDQPATERVADIHADVSAENAAGLPAAETPPNAEEELAAFANL